jgi:hypothetical protein
LSARAWLLVLPCAACVLRPLDLSGKSCVGTCPEGYSCQSGECVPDGKSLCDVLHPTSCLDFESTGIGDWTIEVPPGFGAFRIVPDGGTLGAGLQSATPSLDGGTAGRLDLPLPSWQHVRLDFDFLPQLNPPSGDVSIAEIQCASSYQGAWFHYVHGANAFALVAGPDGTTINLLAPAPAMGAWSHLTLEVTSALRGTVSVNDEHAADVSFAACPSGQWQITLGLNTQDDATFHQARFDNVVVQVTPP